MNIDNSIACEDEVYKDNMNFWRNFYSKKNLRHQPSPFAVWCTQNYLQEKVRLLELGCGNGRDSFAFMSKGINVIAVDGCDFVISENKKSLKNTKNNSLGGFIAHDLSDINSLLAHWRLEEKPYFDVVYTRFFLHAVPEEIEDSVLRFCYEQLEEGGLMLHEFRTVKDPLSVGGEKISNNERWTDHYRRFIDATMFRDKLARQGWEEVYFEENKGLAPFGDEDPVVARSVVRKPIKNLK